MLPGFTNRLAAGLTVSAVDPSMPGLYSKPVHLRAFAMTIETTYTQARGQLKALMDRAVDDHEVILVRRRTGDAAAMIAADELQSLLETAHLLRSPRNAERLLAALARARSEDLPPMSVSVLKERVGFEG
jgi:antitoxin YefM